MNVDSIQPELKHFQIERLADGIYAAVASEQGYASCNAGIIDMGDRTVLFDTFLSPEKPRTYDPKTAIKTEEVVKLLSNECTELKLQTQEREILLPLGLSYQKLTEHSDGLSRVLVETAATALLNYDYKFTSDFLIFGLDPTPHIYVVDQNGCYKPHDYMGFAVIGSGYGMAFPELVKYVWHGGITMIEVLVRVYNAKKAAERMTGVGEHTDLAVLHMGELPNKELAPMTWMCPPELLKILDEGVKTKRNSESDAYVKMVDDVEEQMKRSPGETKFDEEMSERMLKEGKIMPRTRPIV